MIQKKIHYCWFGGSEFPEIVEKCIESWKTFCPEYEIIRWDESNYDVNKIPYIKQAYELKKYAFVSDYARLDIIYNNGGIYLDTDVELIKPLDELLTYSCFMGMELIGKVATGLGFGAEKNNSIVLENLMLYHNKDFLINSKMDTTTCVQYTTELLEKKGLTNENEIQMLNGITILPTDYLCPINIETNKMIITDNTFSIHHYAASWCSSNELSRIIKKNLLPIKVKTRKLVNRFFGNEAYDKLIKVVKRMN